MKNYEMLKFIPACLKIKKMCKMKTQEMCDKAIVESGGMLRLVAGCYKNQKTFNKSVNNYFHALQFVSHYYKTQKSVIKLLILILLQ